MSFIDEVNAVELGQKAKAKAPLIVAGAVVVLLAAGVAAFAALQPPVTVVNAAQQGAAGGADETDGGDDVAQGDAAASGQGEGAEGATGGNGDAQGSNSSGSAGTATGTGAPAIADSTGDSALYVHVGGCVAVPGLYRMAPGARLDDAVRAAGGMTSDAAFDAVNLAALLEDGQQIIVPSKDQVEGGQWGQGISQRGANGSGASATQGSGAAASSGPLNLNQATAEQLVQLNGIGEALAQRIVADREKNGPFSSVDDLTRVSGIGEKKLEGFRDDVCV